MTHRKQSSRLLWMCMVAIFAALLVVLNLTGLGMIRLWIIDLTTYCVVVVAGALVLGWKGGAILGGVFGLLSFWTALTAPSALVAPVVQWHPLAAFILSVFPRIGIGLAAAGIYHLLSKTRLNAHASACIAAVCGSLSNTVFYLGTMLLMYSLMGQFTTALLTSLALVVVNNGILEAVLAGIICAPVVAALKKLKGSSTRF